MNWMDDEQANLEDVAFRGDLLVQRAKGGSLSELGDLLETFRPILLRLARAKVDSRWRHRMSESDIVQQTMLTASARFADFRGTTEVEFRNWLMRIFETRLTDGFRRHRLAERRRTSNERSGLSSNIADPEDSAATALQCQEDAERLLAAILSLPEEEREIVLLRYSAQVSFHGIAKQLDIPLSTVWRRWSHAVDHLRVRLTQSAVDV